MQSLYQLGLYLYLSGCFVRVKSGVQQATWQTSLGRTFEALLWLGCLHTRPLASLLLSLFLLTCRHGLPKGAVPSAE